MRGDSWLQKILYLLMAGLGIYILYKGGGLLLGGGTLRTALGSGSLQKELEDSAVRTYAPGYAAAVENRGGGSPLSGWMRQIVPVYSYLADQEKETEETGLTESADGQAAGEPRETLTAEEGAGGAGDESMETLTAAGGTAGGVSEGWPARGETAGGVREGLTAESGTAGGASEGWTAAGETADGVSEGWTAEKGAGGQEDGTAAKKDAGGSGDGEAGRNETENLPEETRADASDHSIAENSSQSVPRDNQVDSLAPESVTASLQTDAVREAAGQSVSGEILERLADYDYLLANYFTVDEGTAADEELLDGVSLLEEDLTIQKNPQVPQILIYHTHSQEDFIDSVPGDTDTTILGMGEVLAEALRDRYGYQVIHDTGVYDLVDGVLDRGAAYDYARASVQNILAEHPTLEVVIDLHRDGVEGQKFVTEIDGQPTSMVMFFNGISRDSQDEPIPYLPNPYTAQNLAFSLQLQVRAREQYPGFTRNIYLKAERYNLHLRPRSLLIEAGTQLNTVEEERNAMYPLAELIDQVLSGRKL